MQVGFTTSHSHHILTCSTAPRTAPTTHKSKHIPDTQQADMASLPETRQHTRSLNGEREQGRHEVGRLPGALLLRGAEEIRSRSEERKTRVPLSGALSGPEFTLLASGRRLCTSPSVCSAGTCVSAHPPEEDASSPFEGGFRIGLAFRVLL